MAFGKLNKSQKAKLALTSKSSDEEVRKAFRPVRKALLPDVRPTWRLREIAKTLPHELKLVKDKSRIKADIFVIYETDDQFLPSEKELKHMIKFTKDQLAAMTKAKADPNMLKNVKHSLDQHKKKLKEFKTKGNSKPRYTKYTNAQIVKMLQSPEMLELLNDANQFLTPEVTPEAKFNFKVSRIQSVKKMSNAWLKKRDLFPDIFSKVSIYRISCTLIVNTSPKKTFTTSNVLSHISNSLHWDFHINFNIGKQLTRNFKRHVYRGTFYFSHASVNIDHLL